METWPDPCGQCGQDLSLYVKSALHWHDNPVALNWTPPWTSNWTVELLMWTLLQAMFSIVPSNPSSSYGTLGMLTDERFFSRNGTMTSGRKRGRGRLKDGERKGKRRQSDRERKRETKRQRQRGKRKGRQRQRPSDRDKISETE